MRFLPQRSGIPPVGRLVIVLASIAAAVGPSAVAFGAEFASDLRGRWVGVLRTVQGQCPDQRSSTLVIDRERISFAPADGILVLHGTWHRESGRLHAQLLLPGIDKKPVPMVFEARAAGDAIAGHYGTPACRAEITLRRP